MSVINSNEGFLTNVECLHLMQQMPSGNAKHSKGNSIVEKTRRYLESSSSKRISLESLKDLLVLLKGLELGLTEAEILGLVNSVPQSAVEIHAVCPFLCLFKSYILNITILHI